MKLKLLVASLALATSVHANQWPHDYHKDPDYASSQYTVTVEQKLVTRELINNGVVCKTHQALVAIATIPGAAAELAKGGVCLSMDPQTVQVIDQRLGKIMDSEEVVIIHKGYPLYTVEQMLVPLTQ